MQQSKTKKHDSDAAAEGFTVKYDSESIANMALKVKAEGFVPALDLQEQFGPETFTRCIAVLYSDFRMFRRVTRPWKNGENVVGYEWADRRFSKSEIKNIPPQLGFLVELTTKLAPKYGDYELVTTECRYTTAALGGCPVKDTDGTPINSFERDAKGQVLILRYNQQAMITPALRIIGKEQSIARNIEFETIRLTVNGNLTKVDRPVNDHGQGKGFCRSERLADGTTFTIRAHVPTSMLSVAEYLRALKLAGETVGLSPGRSAGFGDFEIVSAE